MSFTIAPDGTPYIAYYGNSYSLNTSVIKYTGGLWTLVGSANFAGNYSDYISLAIANDGTPYVLLPDIYNAEKMSVMKFSGGAWVKVGNAGLSSNAYGFLSIEIASDGSPYIACSGSTTSAVMRFNGSSWDVIGSTVSAGGKANLALAPDGKPYVAYQSANVYKLSQQQTTTINLINRQNPLAKVTNASSVTFRITFASPVSGLTASNFNLSSAITSVTPLDGSPANQWDITVNTATLAEGAGWLNVVNATNIIPIVTTPLPFGDYSVWPTPADGTGIDLFTHSYKLDRTPPTITIPAYELSPIIEATDQFGALFTFHPTVSDSSDPAPTLTWSPVLSRYPFGATTVTFTATDWVGNTSTKQVTVTVRDTVAPSVIYLNAQPSSSQIQLNWAGYDVANSISYILMGGLTPPANCSGTPLYSGTNTTFTHTDLMPSTNYFYLLCVTDKAGYSSSKARNTSTLTPLPTISGSPTTNVILGAAYSFIPTTSYANIFSISGTIPPGFNFNTTTGVLSGTPITSGTYNNIVITAANVSGSTSLAAFTLTVEKATPSITTAPSATGISFGQALSASTLSGGAGSVSGSFTFTAPATVPSAVGNYSAAITFTPTDTANYNTVSGTVNVTVAALINGACGSANTSFVSAAPSANLCNPGIPTTVVGSGPWGWKCISVNGGSSASCTANVLNPTPVVTAAPPAVNYTTVKDGTTFDIFRSEAGKTYTAVATAVTTPIYTDATALKPNTVYQYAVSSDADPTPTVFTTVRTPLYNGWNIVAVPYSTGSTTPASFFSNTIGTVFEWQPSGATIESSTSQLGSYAVVSNFTPGKAYFVKTATGSDTLLANSGGSAGPTSTTVTLNPGWTMISNPNTTNKTDIKNSWLIDGNPLANAITGNKIGGGIYWWNGSAYDSWSIVGDSSLQIEPWKGYWILNMDTVPHTLTIQ